MNNWKKKKKLKHQWTVCRHLLPSRSHHKLNKQWYFICKNYLIMLEVYYYKSITKIYNLHLFKFLFHFVQYAAIPAVHWKTQAKIYRFWAETELQQKRMILPLLMSRSDSSASVPILFATASVWVMVQFHKLLWTTPSGSRFGWVSSWIFLVSMQSSV